ncbi:MAG: sterol desaturase family protein [Burkholderiaceae bacterium]|nr:sterol desaturase family protein [Burkholderiaceae bacterium]
MEHLVLFQLAVTGLLLLISLLEALVLQSRGPGAFDWSEAWLSIGDMIGRRLLALLPLSIATPVFAWAWSHRLFTIELDGVAEFLLLFVGLEFFYYWYHRTAHRVRFFWATHSVHHSPNQLTLSTAFRLGWTGKLTGTGLFFTPLALLGFDPKVVLTALSLNLLYQFWLHTTWIPKLGWLEYVLNTPSAHRVHHASNLDYLDANYGGVLIVFDRIFGTYVAEREAEPCVYGLVKPMRTRNLLTMEFSQWKDLWLDLRAARSLAQAMAFVLKPPGWSPDGKGETTEDMRGARALPAGSSTSGFVRSGS